MKNNNSPQGRLGAVSSFRRVEPVVSHSGSGSSHSFPPKGLDGRVLSPEQAFAIGTIEVDRIRQLLLISRKMDWQGQKLSEQLMQIMLVAVAVAAYVTGFMIESFRVMMLIYAGGVVLITLITVPNWPLFNRHPLKWLEPSVAEEYSKEPPQQQAVASGKKKSAKK